MTNLITASFPNSKLGTLNTIFYFKRGTSTPGEKRLIPDLGPEMSKIHLNHLDIPERSMKDHQGYIEQKAQELTWWVPSGQRWNSFTINKNNDCNIPLPECSDQLHHTKSGTTRHYVPPDVHHSTHGVLPNQQKNTIYDNQAFILLFFFLKTAC